MTVYTAAAQSPSAWPQTMETVYQHLPRQGAAPPGARRGDLSVADRLFAAAVVAIPRKLRYGAVMWLATGFGTSRQTIYDIAAAMTARPPTLPVRDRHCPPDRGPAPAPGVRHNDLARAALTVVPRWHDPAPHGALSGGSPRYLSLAGLVEHLPE